MVVLPVAEYLKAPPRGKDALVYGPEASMKAAWLAGARDYLRDPWTVEELYLRLRGPVPSLLVWDEPVQRLQLEGTVLRGDSVTALTAAEADLLRLLALRRGMAVSRAVLARAAGCAEGRVVDTLVGRLRIKLRDVGSSGRIVAVRGVGYRLP